MRNLKKLLAVVVAICVLATFTVPAFAADAAVAKTDAQIAEGLGVVQGQGGGVSADYLASTPTRLQGAIMFLRLKGLETAAKAFLGTDNFADVSGLNETNKAILAYLKATPDLGFEGVGDNKFAPLKVMTAKEYYKIMLVALGFTYKTNAADITDATAQFGWDNLLAFAEAKGLKKLVNNTTFTVNDLCVGTVEALKATIKDGTKTLIADLVAQNVISATAAETAGLYSSIPATLDVTSVSADNLKEIKVVFNQAVDKTSAENKDAYVLVKGIATKTIDSAELQADGATVVLTVAAGLENQKSDYKLSVNNVKSKADAAKTVSKKDMPFIPLDTTLPTVTEVTALGNKAVKVTFSEPVTLAQTVAASFKIDGVVVSGTKDVTGRTITLTLYNTVADGAHKLTINGNVIDYAGYMVVEITKDFTVEADTVAPTIAEVKDVTLEGATVVFSEDVKKLEAEKAGNYFWKQASSEKAAATATMIDGKTVKITFAADKKLPGYTTELYVKNIVDYSGNKIADGSKITVTATVDQTRPEVLSYKYDNDARTMTLTFSKALALTSFKAANVIVKDKDAKVKANGYTAGLDSTSKILTITFSSKLGAGTYTFDFSGMKDTTLLENAMLPFNTSLEVKNTDAPKVTGITGTGSVYILTFDKEMDTSSSYSVLNPANYFVTYITTDATPKTISGLLPDATNLSPVNGNKGVMITFPDGVKSITSLTVQGVKDIDGNFLLGYADTRTITAASGDLTITKAEATAKDMIVLTMSQPMDVADAISFVVDDTAASIANTVVIKEAKVDESDNTKVNLTLTTELTADAKNTNNLEVYTSSVAGNRAATKGVTGLTLTAVAGGAGTPVVDKIASSVLKNSDGKVTVDLNAAYGTTEGLEVTSVSTNAAEKFIVVNFDETIAVKNATKLNENFKLYKADGTELVYGNDYTALLPGGSTVKISLLEAGEKLAGWDGNIQVVFDNANENIIDAAADKNIASGFDTAADTASDAIRGLILFATSPWIVEAKVTPVVTTVTSFGAIGDVLTLTFNEDLSTTMALTTTPGGVYAMDDAEFNEVTNLTATGGEFTAKVVGKTVIITVVKAFTALDADDTVAVAGTETTIVTDLANHCQVANATPINLIK